jgi:hypothetical protein
MHFGSFLKKVDSTLYNQYVLDRYTDGATKKKPHQNLEDVMVFHQPSFRKTPWDLLQEIAPRLTTLAPNHSAVRYARERKIPESKWNQILFLSQTKDIRRVFDGYDNIENKEPRLVFPYFDCGLNLSG